MKLTIVVALTVTIGFFVRGGVSTPAQPHSSPDWIASANATVSLPPALTGGDLGDRPGVVTFAGVSDLPAHWMQLYNDDGSLWLAFSFEDKERNRDEIPFKLRPFVWHPDYYLLAFECVAVERDRWKVVVDKMAGLTKYIRKDDPAFKFQTWGEYTRDAGCIFLPQEGNPVRLIPDGDEIVLPRNVRDAGGVSIDGDWLEISWETVDYPGGQVTTGSGWLRWRKDGVILIPFGVCC